MDHDEQMEWMELNLSLLIERAAQNGVGAYVIYGQLLAAAAGVGMELDDELQEEMHDALEEQIEFDLVEMLEGE